VSAGAGTGVASRWWGVGVGLATVVFFGITLLFAFEQSPFQAPDETAHLGYAQSVAAFDLPRIDSPLPIPDGATQWQAEIASRGADRYHRVWVANHPPLSYVIAAPAMWLANAQGRADGGLLYLRVVNAAAAAVGVAMTYLVAWQMTGGNRRLALASSCVAALVPNGHIVFSQGLNDGLAFASGTAVVWAGLRVLRQGATRASLAILAAAAAVAAGSRTATMLIAAAVVVYVCVGTAARVTGPLAGRLRAFLRVVAYGLGPALILWGWFYVRNIVLYGDVGASDYLLRMFLRHRRGSPLGLITEGHVWVDVYRGLLSPSTTRRVVPRYLTVATVLVGAGLAVAVVSGRTADDTAAGRSPRHFRAAVGLGALVVVVSWLTILQHYSGGGNPYARYLFPALGVIATFAVIGVDRLVPRAGPVLLVLVLGWWSISNLPVGRDPTRLRRPNDGGELQPVALRQLPVGDDWRLAVAIAIGVSAVGAFVALLLANWPPRWRRPVLGLDRLAAATIPPENAEAEVSGR